LTILVTGATGFVGSALVRRLVAEGQRVRALVRRATGPANLEGVDCERYYGDLLDPESLKGALRGCSGLIHAAADYRLWVPDPDMMMVANVDATRTLMILALNAGVERIVYTSSVATLRVGRGRVADETSAAQVSDMIGAYKLSKFLAEEEVTRLVAKRGLPAVIVNPSTPIGPRDRRPTPTGRTILEAAAGRMPAYVDTGLNLVHVDDVAAGHWLAYQKGTVGERYILGGENLTLAEILREVAAITGRPAPRWRVPVLLALAYARIEERKARKAGTEPFATVDAVKMARKKMFFSSAKAERDLGYTARPAKEALADAVSWFRENGMLAG
jgi:dihydroflavonol-4-reductase